MPRHTPFNLTAEQSLRAHDARVRFRQAVSLGKPYLVQGTDSHGVERTFEVSTPDGSELKGDGSSERIVLNTPEGWKSLHTWAISKIVI
jgi:hypothetical protein